MVGFIIGFFIGCFVLSIGQTLTEKESVQNGIIKLCGKYFIITPLNKGIGGDE